ATILEMGQLAQRLMAKAGEAIITKDVDLALQLETDDDAMDLLHRTLFQHLMDDRWKHGIETAVDVTLLGRYYERFADHAVSVAKRAVYMVAGDHADEIRSGLQPEILPAPGVEGACGWGAAPEVRRDEPRYMRVLRGVKGARRGLTGAD